MDLRIIRNFLVCMTPPQSRVGEVEVSIIRVPRIDYVLLDAVYTPDRTDKDSAMLLQIDVKLVADLDEKRIAKQFFKQIQERVK